MKYRVAIYARLSREDEYKIDGNKESKSIENQVKVLTQYAINNEFEIFDVYYDDGYSGATLDRPEFQRLMKDMKLHKFNVVLVKDVSRLGRNLHKVGELIDIIFPTNNIRLISINDKYDSLNYKNEESIVLRNFLNDYYRKDFRKKVRNSIKFKARTAHMSSTPKFGYNYDKDGNEFIDEQSADVIRKIYYYVGNKGISLAKTAEILNEDGCITRSQHLYNLRKGKNYKRKIATRWDRHAVKDVASDYEYCGHSINLVTHCQQERILLKDTHLKIIDEDLFNKTQEVIRFWRKVGRHGHYNHIAQLIKNKDNTNISYVFSPERENKKSNACYSCRGVKSSLNADYLHKVVFQDCVDMISNCKLDSERVFGHYQKGILNGSDNKRLKLKKELEDCNLYYSKLLEKYFNEQIAEDLFEQKSTALQKKIKELELQINQCNDAIERLRLFEIRFRKFLNSLKDEPKNELDIIRLVVSKIYVNKINNPKSFDITIVYKFEE